MRVSAACLAMMSLLLAFDSLASKPESPNFILVLTDDQGWTSMSAAMDSRYPTAQSDYHRTPALEAIAAAGMRFSSAYSASPVCSPSRYSIQFGKSPARLGRTRVLGENQVDHDQVEFLKCSKEPTRNIKLPILGNGISMQIHRGTFTTFTMGKRLTKRGVMIMIRKPNGAATARPIRNESLV